jgi:hypothetical protein
MSNELKLEPNLSTFHFELSTRFSEAIMNPRFLLLAAFASTATIALAQQKNATVSLALDWVPNVNHVGVYVAQSQVGMRSVASI